MSILHASHTAQCIARAIVDSRTHPISPLWPLEGPAAQMEWAMESYLDDEAFGAKAFTWTIIAASALLLVEVTWPQALPAPSAPGASVQAVTVSAHPQRIARVN
jgi:hypothetical protein